MSGRCAVLVDGDNVSPRHAAAILEHAGRLGRLDICRSYLSAGRPSEWLSAPGWRPIHAGCGKNAADILLCIDAMELALAGGVTAFALASSDGDLSHVAQRLRERGLAVLGLGAPHAAASFRLACTRFEELAEPAPAASKMDAEPKAKVKPPSFDQRVCTAIAQNGAGERGIRVTDLSLRMKAEHNTQISKRPEKTWRAYLLSKPLLYDLDPRGPDAMVRLRPQT